MALIDKLPRNRTAHLALHQWPRDLCSGGRQACPLVANAAHLQALYLRNEGSRQWCAGASGGEEGVRLTLKLQAAQCTCTQRVAATHSSRSGRPQRAGACGTVLCGQLLQVAHVLGDTSHASPAHLHALVGHELQVAGHRAIAQQDDLRRGNETIDSNRPRQSAARPGSCKGVQQQGEHAVTEQGSRRPQRSSMSSASAVPCSAVDLCSRTFQEGVNG